MLNNKGNFGRIILAIYLFGMLSFCFLGFLEQILASLFVMAAVFLFACISITILSRRSKNISKKISEFIEQNKFEECISYLLKEDKKPGFQSINVMLRQTMIICCLGIDDIPMAEKNLEHFTWKDQINATVIYYAIIIKIDKNELDRARELYEQFINTKLLMKHIYDSQREMLRELFNMIDNKEYNSETILSTSFPVIKRIFERHSNDYHI